MPLSRRHFMQGSAALAAATPMAANDRVQIGVIGTGARSHELMQALMMHPQAEIVAVSDAYQGRVQRALVRVGKKAKAVASYKDLIGDKSIDAVLVATPDHWHKTMVIEAINAGKDVYCEKPLTYKSAEGLEIIEAAKKANKIVQVG